MNADFDVVVAGAGHNSLVAAAYLAAAGMKVLVLERNAWIGGGAVTREVTVPGFRHDLHSTAHIMIQSNPLINRDELGLIGKFGLEYIRPEISFASVFDDGSVVLTYHDLDKTCESLAKISPRDAESYRRHVEKMKSILPMFVSGLHAPPLPFGTTIGLLEQSEQGRELIGIMNKSAMDIVNELFENEILKVHFAKFSSEAMSGPEEKGTGLVFNLIVGMSHSYHGGLPVGGSVALPEALVRCIEHHGGALRTEAEMVRVIVEGGQAVGVELKDGEEIRAKRAVIACIHPHTLDQFVAGVDPTVVADAKRTHHGGYSSMNTHYALHEAPRYTALEGLPDPMVVECLPAKLDTFRQEFDDLRYNRRPAHPSLVCATHTNFDKSRAPEGKATLYKYSFMPYDLNDGGSAAWDDVKEEAADRLLDFFRKFTTNMSSDNIIARHVDSPLDYERSTPSFRRGDVSGIGRYLYQFLGRRPTPALSQYAVPGVEKLYLSGPFMHPGGGVIGGGRATAIKIMGDLGMDFDRLFVE
ncbi:NAD(P)/FAD-dependent oxidoreductase [Sphingobium aromaticiconvertens]|uniref:phytoene desaturase family protein n=3 Tax=Sphingobium TaxID=165695 RepID=UPI0030195600